MASRGESFGNVRHALHVDRLGHHPMRTALTRDRKICSNLGAAFCRCISFNVAEWDMSTIEWHPQPGPNRVYALMDKAGNLHIIDGRRHQQLSTWTWQELSKSSEAMLASPRSPSLSWSPDGTQLAVLAPGLTALITFGQK